MNGNKETKEAHPLSAIWPEMSAAEKNELVADIKINGVRSAVVFHEGKILDGWHRWKAALITGRDCPVKDYIGNDPAGFVISKNARRRHLSKGDIAEAVARTRAWAPTGRPAEVVGEKKPVAEKSTVAGMAKEAGVSAATMNRAKRVLSGKKPASGEAVEKPQSPLTRANLEIKALGNRIAELEGEVEGLDERLAVRADADSPEVSKREAVVTNQRAEISALKSQVREWQTKCNDWMKVAKSHERTAKRLQGQIDKVDLGAR